MTTTDSIKATRYRGRHTVTERGAEELDDPPPPVPVVLDAGAFDPDAAPVEVAVLVVVGTTQGPGLGL